MGVTGRLMRAAARRPHVLVAAMPGGTASRLAVEAYLRRRNWPTAWSPADADLLVVCGAVPTALRTAVEELWAEIPRPRARTDVAAAVFASGALDSARARLAAPNEDRSDPQGRSDPHAHATPSDRTPARDMSPPDPHHADSHAVDASPGPDGGHGGQEEPPQDSGQGMSGRGVDHPGMSHGDMDDGMSMPAGLAMAERGDDRDGLKLDQLHVALGPVLAGWPAGLVLRVTLQGDVIQSARTEFVGAEAPGSFWVEPVTRAMYGEAVTVGEAARRTAACYLDRLGRFLSVAGWPDPAAGACVLRDDLLAGAGHQDVASRFAALARRVGRSRTLAWMTAGLGVLSTPDATALGVTGPAARAGGDVTARYRQWLAEAADLLELVDDPVLLTAHGDGRALGQLHDAVTSPEPLLAAIERLVVGAEIGAARLVVASFDPDVDEMAGRPAAVANG